VDDGTGAPGEESGSSLRNQLETTIEANKGLTSELAKVVASNHKFVKPEDLHGIGYDQMATKAAELSAQRAEERAQILREELEARGLQGDQLEAALVSKGEAPATPAPTPFASTGSLGGTPPALVPTDNVRGVDRIRAAIAEGNK